MKTMIVALGMLVLLGGQLAGASVDAINGGQDRQVSDIDDRCGGRAYPRRRPYGHLGRVIRSDAGLAGDRLK